MCNFNFVGVVLARLLGITPQQIGVLAIKLLKSGHTSIVAIKALLNVPNIAASKIFNESQCLSSKIAFS